MITEEQAKGIAAMYLADNPLGHPDYEWILGDWSEAQDLWLFPFCIRCRKPIPKEDQENFAGAPGFGVSKTDGAVRTIAWPEWQKLKR